MAGIRGIDGFAASNQHGLHGNTITTIGLSTTASLIISQFGEKLPIVIKSYSKAILFFLLVKNGKIVHFAIAFFFPFGVSTKYVACLEKFLKTR